MEGLPKLPLDGFSSGAYSPISKISTDVLIIGGGPAGLSAAIELGKNGIDVLVVDDKQQLGGKLVLQTHRFFGSIENVHAGTRGIEIAAKLDGELSSYHSVSIWKNSVAVAVFSDKTVGVMKNGKEYILVHPKILLSTTGAREKSLMFKGNTLPGVMGAGAFQTIVNRDLVKISERLFIIGGGNVGLIAGYHALQAGIEVAGLAEALPQCGGYLVHRDKLARFGVPIYTSHTILAANGSERVESVTIAEVDTGFSPIPGTEKTIECDAVLIAVGLEPVNEFFVKAREFGMDAYAAGDAEEIAEASVAMITGKIRGMEIARRLGRTELEVPAEWLKSVEILKSKPGRVINEIHGTNESGVVPVIHCTQEIPCDPCSRLCQQELIRIALDDIRKIPQFIGSEGACKGCFKCLVGCPGLAITLVDYRKNSDNPLVSIPLEFGEDSVKNGEIVALVNTTGTVLGAFPVYRILGGKSLNGTWILQVNVPKSIAQSVAGVILNGISSLSEFHPFDQAVENETIVCRCERVSAGEIRDLIRKGYTDVNEIKAICRAGMGACGGKTCLSLINRIFREEGISSEKITESTVRPLFVEIPLSRFAGHKND
jgi:NADPH-dependent 2,4-dienoyl-CoA reductase/sulfur reductase-like enzyme/bacterioferritin-associated ferredoxin/Pyruvate/2-oxoacid:ferredoxin oxidoreductase delta subunit